MRHGGPCWWVPWLGKEDEAVLKLALAVSVGVSLASWLSTAQGQGPSPTPGTPTMTQTPTVSAPAHASEFHGAVTVAGESAPDGSVIEGVLEGIVCGTTITTGGGYSISVKSGVGTGVDFQEGCGENGDTVQFRTGGVVAGETGQFSGGTAQTLDLVFTGVAPGQSTPAAALPRTGSGGAPGAATPNLLSVAFLVLFGVTILAAVAVAARRFTRP